MSEHKHLERKAAEIRRDLLEMIFNAKNGHTGGSLSSVDILTVLYYEILRVDADDPKAQDRDRFVHSKGHSVEGLYTILADKGFIPKSELATFTKYKSRLIGHPSVKVPGVELNTGALGHGLSASVGMALGAKRSRSDAKVYCFMGDGELAEGSVWEAAMAAVHYKLDNLTAIIDRNNLQISGNTEDVMSLEQLPEKWTAFGWDVSHVDGHDIPKLVAAFRRPAAPQRPRVLIAKTVKGRGVSYMEGQAKWHHRVPSLEEYEKATEEFNRLIGELG